MGQRQRTERVSEMHEFYNPCNDCKQKAMCSKCAYHKITTNYIKALDKLKGLCNELGSEVNANDSTKMEL